MKPWPKFLAIFHRKKFDVEMSEEMRLHLEQRVRENIAAGMSPEDARYAAMRRFGGVEQMKEIAREQRGWRWLENLTQDVRYGARTLRKNPGFASVAILTIALGIGACTAMFSAVNALILRPLRVPDAGRIVYVTSGRDENFSYQFFEYLREHAKSLAGLVAVQYGASRRELVATGLGATDVESVRAQAVTGNFFSVLGVPALLGRNLSLDDDRAGAAEPVIVISHAFWQRRFAADPAVVGKAVLLDNVPLTIVGVMPAGFSGFEVGADPDLWWPMQLTPQLDGGDRNWAERLTQDGVNWLVLFGRLPADFSRESAQTEALAIFRRRLEREVASNPKWTEPERQKILNQTLELHPGAAGYVGVRSQFKQPLFILTAVVGVVLLIACANVAGLLLARAAGRQREFAVRAALGAGRWRIVRQLVTESLLVAIAGGLAGLLFARWGTDFLAGYLPPSETEVKLTPDGRVLWFTAAVSLITGVLFGLAPALRLSRSDLVTSIKNQGGQMAGGARQRLQPALVTAQIALSVLLLAGAGLFARTLHNLQTLDLGFQRENLISFSLESGRRGGWRPDARQRNELEHRLLDALATLPGTRSVTISGAGMLSGNGYNTGFRIEGYTPAPDEAMRAAVVLAGPGFFETLRVPLVRGREFRASDEPAPGPNGAPGTATVAIIGETMARKYFRDADPIGRQLTRGLKDGVAMEIIGVAKETKYTRNLRDKTPLEFYVPYFGGGVRMPMTAYVRTDIPLPALAPQIRRLVAQIDPRLSVRNLLTMDDVVDRLLMQERVVAQLVGFFSAFALMLSSLGLYGVLSYGVTQRTREIGVRMALGARARDVLALVVGQGVRLALLGTVLGLAVALAATRFASKLLYGVTPDDPLTLAGVAVLLLVVATFAAWLPARRAARVDPMTALRAE